MKKILTGLSVMAAVLLTLTAQAHVTVTVTCPDGTPLEGVLVSLTGTCNPGLPDQLTDTNGIALFQGFNSICEGQEMTVTIVGTAVAETFTFPPGMLDFPVTLVFNSAACPQPANHCWLTGGGTIKDGKGKPVYSFGGNVNPGCSPVAGEGGNWNLEAHDLGLRFDATAITVLDCGNVPGVEGSTSPVTPFSFIDWEGTGIVKGIAGNKFPTTPVTFIARYLDLGEPGGGVDALYLMAFDAKGCMIWESVGIPTVKA
jgi:hypothetical protein